MEPKGRNVSRLLLKEEEALHTKGMMVSGFCGEDDEGGIRILRK